MRTRLQPELEQPNAVEEVVHEIALLILFIKPAVATLLLIALV